MKNLTQNQFVLMILLLSLCINGYATSTVPLDVEVISKTMVNKKLKIFTLKDQFNKQYTLNQKTKVILFAFSKATSDIMNLYMSTKAPDYLTSQDIFYIADISGMPSLVTTLFAIPIMKENKFPILLIYNKIDALHFRYEEHQDKIMIITLDNQIVKSIKFVTNEYDLETELSLVSHRNKI